MEFNVEGMTCGHCVRSITRAIQALDPEAVVDVDLSGGTVAVEGGLEAGLAIAAIESEGYVVVGAGPGASPTGPACGCNCNA
jgi:copper chaperone